MYTLIISKTLEENQININMNTKAVRIEIFENFYDIINKDAQLKKCVIRHMDGMKSYIILNTINLILAKIRIAKKL